jgi:apolipoprotein N-acyltransferase
MAYTHPILTLPADRPRISRLIALLLGCLTTLAFEPFGWSLLAPVLLLPLLFVCLTLAPRDAARHAFWYGLGLFLCGTYWIYISVVVFGEAPGWIALFLMVGLSAIMAAWLFAAGYVISYLAQGEPLLLLPIAPAAWVLVEWLRGWVASGFPWLAFGYAQADSSLAGWAPLLGVYGSSFAVLLSASAIVAAIMSRGRVRQFSLAMILLPWLMGAVLLRVDWTEPDGDPLRVTILQAGMSQDQKWLPENRLPTLDFYRSQSLAEKDSDIVVWPEVAIPNLISREREFIAALAEDAKASGQSILFGILEDNENRGERRVYNSVVLLDGQRQQVYRKRHLVPFGEYFPVPDKVREWMKMMSLPYSDLTPGADRQELLATRDGTRLALMVCYEDAYNSEQLYALPEAGLLVNVSNDAWFGNSIAPHQHLEIARMRSIEAGRPGIRATNTGISAFIDYDGRLLQTGRQFGKEILTTTLQPRGGSTPFVASGNWPTVTFCCLLLGFFWIQRPR